MSGFSMKWYIGLGVLLLGLGCRQDPVELLPCAVVQQELSQEQEVFLDLCFGIEFGEDYERIRKWSEDVSIYLPVRDSLLEDELGRIMSEINALSGTISLSIAPDSVTSNLLVYFGNKQNYAASYEPAAQGLISSNFGLFSATWNSSTYEITRGTVCVDVEREDDPACLRHLLREELTQVLGIMNDTDLYPESIFFTEYTCETGYTNLDRRFIQDFLSDRVQAGMCRTEVVEALF